MYKDLMNGINFFQDKNSSFIAAVGPYLKVIKMEKNEYVYNSGEYSQEIFFIKSGSVSLVIKEFHDLQFMTIKEGYYFGEVLFYKKKK